MSRYIDADALKESWKEIEIDGATLSVIYGLLKSVDEAPSIDIVRCKECVYCANDWNGNQPMFTCELGRCGESVQPNDFCSYGELW